MTVVELRNTCAAPWGTPLLQGIDAQLASGEVLALAGPNGAGKSSLLRLVAGDFSPDTGAIHFMGKAVADWPRPELARSLAFLPQMSLLAFPYTVEEVVMLGRTPHDTGYQLDLGFADQAMALTDISHLRERLYTTLSGGEKQRTQLARVLAQLASDESLAGKLLLLDEPTSALDLAHQQQVLSAVRGLADRGCAVILVIHDLNLVTAVADQVMVLDRGRQVAIGKPREVLTQDLFRSVFGVDVIVQRHPVHGYPVIFPAGGGS